MIKLNFPNVGVYFLQKKILRKTATIQKKTVTLSSVVTL